MALEIWLAFALASAVLPSIPGPTVLLVVSYALARGRLSAWATVPGVTLGDFTAITASLLGAGALLQASAAIYRPGASAPDASRYPGGDLPLPRNAQHYSLGFDGK